MHSSLYDKWAKTGITGLWALMITTSIARSSSTPQYIALEEVSRTAGCRHAITDYDLDGMDEVVVLTCDQKNILLHGADLGILLPVWHIPLLDGECHRVEAHNISGDTSPEIFVSLKRADTVWVQVYDSRRELLKETEPIIGKSKQIEGTWDGFIDKLNVIDADGDGQKDILASVCTSYDLIPRGLYAFQWQTGELLWHYKIACHVMKIVPSDLDGDGIEEILLSTNAPSNGCKMNGMDDAHSYLIALDRKGNLLWRKVISGKFYAPYIDIGDLNQDGQLEIINAYANGDIDDPHTRFELQIREALTGTVRKYFPFTSAPRGFRIEDINHDTFMEIVIGTDNGNMIVFNNELESIHSYKHNSYIRPISIDDIDQDGNPEIIAASYSGLHFFDSTLRNHSEFMINTSFRNASYWRNPFSKGYFLIVEGTSDDAYEVLYKFRVSTTPVSPIRIDRLSVSITYLIMIFMSGIIMGIIVWAVSPPLRRKLKNFWMRRSNIPQRQEALLESLAVFGHGKLATSNLDRLALLFKNVPRQKTMVETYTKKLQETIDSFEEYTAKHLQEIVKRASEAKVSKKAIGTLRRNCQYMLKLISDLRCHQFNMDKIQQACQEATSVSERLEKNVKSIKADLSKHFKCNVAATVGNVLTAAEEEMTKYGIHFKGLTIHGHVGCHGFIQENELSAIIEDLLYNAMKAMEQDSVKELWIEIKNEEQQIFVNVSDTGCGIPEENVPQIFDRDFSTKDGGGFGLYYAKTTLAKYGGNIRILKTEIGKGTTMQIELKKTA